MARQILLPALISFLIVTSSAQATQIDFSGLSGANGDPFTTYAQAGFLIQVTSGTFAVDTGFGNAAPSISSTSMTSSIDVTAANAGPFAFSRVDLGNAGTQGAPVYIIQGFRNNQMVLAASGMLTQTQSFTTIASPNSSQPIDLLRISLFSGSATAYNVDNVVVNAIPEPTSIASAVVGLACLGLVARRRRAAGR